MRRYATALVTLMIALVWLTPVCATPLASTSRTICFQDDFESGMGNWDVGGSTWGLTTETWRSPTHCLTDNPGGNYGSDQEISATLASPLNLSGSVYPVLTFWHKQELGGDSGDYVRVQASSNGGTSRTTLRYWSGDIEKGWMYEQVSLLSYQGSSAVLVRFQLDSDSDAVVDDGWFVDDVSICEQDPVRLPFPFADDFELLRASRPDVVILDLTMLATLAADSAHEGLAALGAITGGYLGEIPVIIATDSCSTCARDWCERLGAYQVLEKAEGLTRVFDAARAAVTESRSRC